jgi:hypothetical protein
VSALLAGSGKAKMWSRRISHKTSVPKQGSWFDLGDSTPGAVQASDDRSGEPVIYADLGTDEDRSRLKPKKHQ